MKNVIFLALVFYICHIIKTDDCTCGIKLISMPFHYTPVFLYPETNNIVYPDEYNIINLKSGEQIEAYCIGMVKVTLPGEIQSFYYPSYVTITCLYNESLLVMGHKIKGKGISCNRPIKPLAISTEEQCGLNGIMIYTSVILYNKNLTFHKNCFNDYEQITEFINFEVLPFRGYLAQTYWQFKANGVFFRLKYPIEMYYDNDVIQANLYAQMKDNEWYNNDTVKFYRMYLVNPQYYFYNYQTKSCLFYINAVPVWNELLAVFRKTQSFARKYARTRKVTLTGYTGTFGRISIPDPVNNSSDKILYLTDVNKIPIPAHIWTVFFDEQNSAGIAFIGINSFRHDEGNFLCNDVLPKITDLYQQQGGLLYACTVSEFYKVIPYIFPNFTVTTTLGMDSSKYYDN